MNADLLMAGVQLAAAVVIYRVGRLLLGGRRGAPLR